MKNLKTFVIFALSLLLLNSNVFAMKRIKRFLPSQKTYVPSGPTPSRFSRERLGSTFAPLKKYAPKQLPSPLKRFSRTKQQQAPWQQETTAPQQKNIGFYPIKKPISRQDIISGKAKLPAHMQLYKQAPAEQEITTRQEVRQYTRPDKVLGMKASLSDIPGSYYKPPAQPMLQPQKAQAPTAPKTPKPELKRQYKARKHTAPSYSLPALPPTKKQQPIVIKPTQAPVKINLLGNQ